MSITHEPRRQRYVIVVGQTRHLSTYGEGLPRAEALAFARELERELIRKAEIVRAFAEEAAQALDARAVLADEQAEADAWELGRCESCGAPLRADDSFECDGLVVCAGCAGFVVAA